MNNETKEALTRQLKLLQEQCKYAYNVIENSPDVGLIPNNIEAKALNYVEALRTDIQNSNTAITTDINLLTSQYLSETKEKTEEVEKFLAFTKGSIYDMNAEIDRLDNSIKTLQEARLRPKAVKNDIHPKHMMKAKERFQLIKKELHGLIYSLYPNCADPIKDVLGQLMQERLDETSSGYIQITSENYQSIRLLNDINLVSQNPYNTEEVKLDF
ncbi:unnamed protein product [Parnassius apollo]|uniref:(apollo) hypothetical protein n=1 Tax=Parnassius apollo TaxID=110799 RepID=A0A8S3VYM3_PARAO|nr:unnamed protein product [Parnassius apollo]